ncbi:ABC transporter permease subunit [Devosia naphthalenivorans]|jgi:polar amino acid transport system permease protein|uniref:ABC transporter permease subunit n=1 Tax=Devosia naphthalenivorans TaxID=2082392 RepID=UPI000D345CD5
MIRGFSPNDILFLLGALRWTALLAAGAFVGSAVVGLVLATMRLSRFRAVRWLAIVYVQLVQGIPLLVWLFLLYFGVAMLGFNVDPWLAAILGFSIYGGAFLGEVWRGAMGSIEVTQWEAGAALGLSISQQLRHVIVPQSVQIAIPPTIGFLVQLIKNTSLASTIGILEVTREGQLTSAATYQPMTVYLVVAALYFALCFPLTQWSRSLERKFNAGR